MSEKTEQLDSLRVMLEEHGMPSVYRPGRGKALRISVTITSNKGGEILSPMRDVLLAHRLSPLLYNLAGVGEQWYRLELKGAQDFAKFYKLLYEGVPFEQTVEQGRRAVTVRLKYVQGLRRIVDDSKKLH